MKKQQFDCIVLGSGPGGYVAAIRAAQRGLKTALVEARETGGTCLNRGCIPSKALIANAEVLRKVRHAQKFGISVGEVSFDYEHMKVRKDGVVNRIRKGLEGLIQSNRITLIRGFGKFVSPTEIKVMGEEESLLQGKTIILATGSEPRELPSMPFDYQTIHDSTSLLNITKLPKRLLIIGGGVIGCEFASLHRAFGVEVTIIEMLPMIIAPEGKQVSDVLKKALEKEGISIKTNTLVQKLEKTAEGVKAYCSDGNILEADMALVSVGRHYNTDKIGLEKTGVILARDGSVPTNERMQTNVAHLYAIGDITAKWLLAHVASHQGLVAADNAAGISTKMHYNAIPSVIFTHPEIGTVGMTLEKAIENGFDAALGAFPFQALGKSQAVIETDGFAQVVIEKKTGRILGAQVVGHEASTLIAEMGVAISNELTVHSIRDTVHAHPTLAESWMEAAFLAEDMPLHLPPKIR